MSENVTRTNGTWFLQVLDDGFNMTAVSLANSTEKDGSSLTPVEIWLRVISLGAVLLSFGLLLFAIVRLEKKSVKKRQIFSVQHRDTELREITHQQGEITHQNNEYIRHVRCTSMTDEHFPSDLEI